MLGPGTTKHYLKVAHHVLHQSTCTTLNLEQYCMFEDRHLASDNKYDSDWDNDIQLTNLKEFSLLTKIGQYYKDSLNKSTTYYSENNEVLLGPDKKQ